MNEDLLNDLGDAMKRRDKAAAAIARWQEQKDDAEEDIRELSARITAVTSKAAEEPEAQVMFAGFRNEQWETVNVPVEVPE